MLKITEVYPGTDKQFIVKISFFLPFLILFSVLNLYSQENVKQNAEVQTVQPQQGLQPDVLPLDTITHNKDLHASVDEDFMLPDSPFLLHKLNYFIFGNPDDQVKAQIEFKYEIIRESELFIAYSQYIFWNLYNSSTHISELNFNP